MNNEGMNNNFNNNYQQPVEQPVYQQPVQSTYSEPVQQQSEKKGSKKGLIVGIVAVLLIAIVAIVVIKVLPKMKKIDYSVAYREVVAINDTIMGLETGKSCSNAKSDLRKKVKMNDYNEEITKCKSEYDNELKTLIDKLGKTDAVKNDKEVKEAYNELKKELDIIIKSGEEIDEVTRVYSLVHDYYYRTYPGTIVWDKLTIQDVESIAQLLKDTGIESFVTYGEKWLELTKDLLEKQADTRHKVWSGDYSRAEQDEAGRIQNEAANTRTNYIKENEPKLEDIYKLEDPDYTNVVKNYKELRTIIASKYEENYKFGTNDCDEREDKTVICK